MGMLGDISMMLKGAIGGGMMGWVPEQGSLMAQWASEAVGGGGSEGGNYGGGYFEEGGSGDATVDGWWGEEHEGGEGTAAEWGAEGNGLEEAVWLGDDEEVGWEECQEGDFEGVPSGSQAEAVLKGLLKEADEGDAEAAEMYFRMEDFVTPVSNKMAKGANSGVKRRGLGGGMVGSPNEFENMVKKAMRGLTREELAIFQESEDAMEVEELGEGEGDPQL